MYNKDVLLKNIEIAAALKGERVTPACANAGVGSSFYNDIRRGRTPSVSKLAQLANYLGVTTSALLDEKDPLAMLPPAYVTRTGVFENWSDIIANKDAVFEALRVLIQGDMEISEYSDSKHLIAALDIAFNWDFNELYLVRWFNDCVERVSFENGTDGVVVSLKLTPSFLALIDYHKADSKCALKIKGLYDGISDILQQDNRSKRNPPDTKSGGTEDTIDMELARLLQTATLEQKKAMLVLLQQRKKSE